MLYSQNISASGYKEELSLVNIIQNLNYDFKQNIITGGPPPTLKHISLIKIATEIWNKKLRHADLRFRKCNKAYEILKIHRKEIKNKVSQLGIPVECIDSLKLLIHSVGKAIIDYVQSYLDTYDHSNIDKLRVFLESIIWTQQGTINILKTSIHIINKSNLSIKDKYEIACNCCLKEKIRDLLNELPDDVIKEFEDNRQPFSLPFFWTSYIRNEELPILIESYPAQNFLIEFAVSKGYYLAIQYIWEKFADVAVKDRLMEYAELDGNDFPNAVFYFAKQMTQVQLEEASSIIHCRLLYKLHSISRYWDILPTSHYMLNLIKTKNVNHAYEVITFCWDRSLLKVEEFINIWKEFVLHFKSDIEKDIVNIYDNTIPNYVDTFDTTQRIMFVINFLCQMTTPQNRDKIILANKSITYCKNLIKYFGLEQFNFFVKYILVDDVCQFKNKFLEACGWNLCSYLIADNKYDVLDKVLIECCAKETIKSFKNKLVNNNISIFISIFDNIIDNETDIISLWNKYLSWCFDGDKNEMIIFRRIMFDVESKYSSNVIRLFVPHMNTLLRHRKWNLLEKHWQWFYYSTDKNITTTKEKLERIKNILYRTFLGGHFPQAYINIDYLVLLKRFIISCFNQEEVEKLKKEFQSDMELILIGLNLLDFGKFQESNDFLEWCFSSNKNEILKFKTTLINFHRSFNI